MSFNSHERTINSTTETEQKIEKIRYPPSVPLPKPYYKWTTPNLPTPPALSPFISSNITIIMMIFLAQMRQSNWCESIRNDEIYNLHLESAVGPWVSISCPLQDTRDIHWQYMPKQSAKMEQKKCGKRSNSQETILFCLGLCRKNPDP